MLVYFILELDRKEFEFYMTYNFCIKQHNLYVFILFFYCITIYILFIVAFFF